MWHYFDTARRFIFESVVVVTFELLSQRTLYSTRPRPVSSLPAHLQSPPTPHTTASDQLPSALEHPQFEISLTMVRLITHNMLACHVRESPSRVILPPLDLLSGYQRCSVTFLL